MAEQLRAVGSEPQLATPEQFGAFLKRDIASWAAVVKISGATID